MTFTAMGTPGTIGRIGGRGYVVTTQATYNVRRARNRWNPRGW